MNSTLYSVQVNTVVCENVPFPYGVCFSLPLTICFGISILTNGGGVLSFILTPEYLYILQVNGNKLNTSSQ